MDGYKHKQVPADQYDQCMATMSKDSREELSKFITDVQRGVDCFVVPLHDGLYSHWHMLIVDTTEKRIYQRNSLYGPRCASATARMVCKHII